MIDDLMTLPVEQRAVALMQASIVSGEDEEYASSAAKKVKASELDFSNDLKGIIEVTTDNAVSNFHRDAKGFRCKTAYKDDKLVYFSIPDDTGWTAEIDGEKTEILDSGGMMLIKVPSGSHSVEFEYHTPWFRLGIIISVLSLILYAIYIWVMIIRNREGRDVLKKMLGNNAERRT